MSNGERRSGIDSQSIAADATETNPPPFIVGIGVSIGGLESLEEFFDHIAEKCNLAFVVVQHLSADFNSIIPELLSRHTRLSIHRVENEMPVRANTVYLIPPKKEMILSRGKLLLNDRDPSQRLMFPIDTFLRTLAHEAGKNCAGIVFSGTGSDGSRGIREIHEAGGLVLVARPESAESDGMSLSEIDTGIVDQVLYPREMAESVARFACRFESTPEHPAVDEPVVEEDWNAIYSLFKQVYGIDLHHFKSPTIRRSNERRLTLNRIEDPGNYAQTWRSDIEELKTKNAELQATNLELLASIEELQNSKEKLKSLNEVLSTLNAEHRRKIVELTELNDDFDNLLQSSDIGTIYIDRALTIRRFTPKLSDLFHIRSRDIGRPLGNFTHIMNYPELLEDVRAVMESGEIKDHDIQDTRGNWYLSRIFPYRSGGEVHGAVLTFTDITGRKQTAEKLLQLSKVFMDAADPIIIEDLNGLILDLNDEAERAYGWSRTELIGHSIFDICPEQTHALSRELRVRCASLENIRNVESARICKSGQVVPVLLTLSLLTDDLKRPTSIAVISKDISDLKRAEHQAREEVSRRDQFLAMLSHELRNPLNAILAAANLLDRQPKGAGISRETGVLRRQSQQMTRLLDDLLDVARITYGRIHFQPQLFDLRELAEDAIQAIQGSLEERRHTLYRQIADEPLLVEGDRTRLLQVLENLMINAAKYTPNGGNIKLTMEGDKQSVIVRVRDNGIGIVPELLHSIFGVFVQAPQEIDRQYGGLGVGLTLAKTLVELHQGSIIAESDGLGRGSEFTVTLPRAESSSCISVPVPESRRPSLPLNIVVVEDNTDNRELLREILKLDGHYVTTASTGAEGVELILKELPQVALVDLGLPVLNGFQVAQKVLETLGPGRVRLVALTGYGQDSDRKAVFEAGFDDFLVKPVSPEDLSAALSAAAVMEIKQD